MDKSEMIEVAIKALKDLNINNIDNIGIEVTEVQQGQFNLEINVYHNGVASDASKAEKIEYLG